MGVVAREDWRKIVPFLESTNKVQRIDTFLVETYCTNYEIYKLAYENVKENGIQQEMKKPIQAQGIELAKKKGRYTGRKSKFQKDDPLLQRAFKLYQSKEYTLKEIESHTKIPVSTLKRYLKKYDIKRN